MTSIRGKGMWIWQLQKVESGEISRVVDRIVEAGLERVELKVADGPYEYDLSMHAKRILLVKGLKERGVSVWGWGFNYGRAAEGEGTIGGKMVELLDLDGYVFDVEGEFEGYKDRVAKARLVKRGFRAQTQKPAVFCSWGMYWNPRIPAYAWHPKDLAVEFMSWCEAWMPMLYWQQLRDMPFDPASSEAALYWLEMAIDQLKAIADKPIVPTGRAYDSRTVACLPEAVIAFGTKLRELGCPGDSWWSLEHALTTKDGGVWQAISNLPRFGGPVPLSEQERLRRIEAWAKTQGYNAEDWR